MVSVKSLYGDYDTPQDFLEAFDSLVQRSPNAQPALQAVINRPRDLTRKGLVELQGGLTASTLRNLPCAKHGKRRAMKISPPG